MTDVSGTPPRRRRRRPRRKKPKSEPAKVIEALTESRRSAPPQGEDMTLTASEALQMKQHFAFLRQYRKVLKLKVNAAEDLLLNGRREPSHRGVCQHLLAKVEKSRVLAATERMSAQEATSFLAGVVRFAPDLSYLIRFLECVKESNTQRQAAAALTQALQQIPFEELSGAQMRQIITLIGDVFPPAELPVFLLSLLDNPEFERTLGRSLDVFPAELAETMVALGALHQALSADGKRRHRRRKGVAPPERDLKRGVLLLLQVSPKSLAEFPNAARRRLLPYACDALEKGQPGSVAAGLVALFEGLTFTDPAQRAQACQRVCSSLLRVGDEERAKALLAAQTDLEASPQLGHWLKDLKAPRVGPVALSPPRAFRGKSKDAPESGGELHPGRWYRGFHIPTQRSVRLKFGTKEEAGLYQEQLRVWQRVLIPSVARIIAWSTDQDVPYVAVWLPGQRLTSVLRRAAKQELSDLAPLARELALILCAVARSGVRLPDADLDRFSLDAHNRLWLVDLWNAEPAEPAMAEPEHVALSAGACAEILNLAGAAPTPAMQQCFENPQGFEQLVETLSADA